MAHPNSAGAVNGPGRHVTLTNGTAGGMKTPGSLSERFSQIQKARQIAARTPAFQAATRGFRGATRALSRGPIRGGTTLRSHNLTLQRGGIHKSAGIHKPVPRGGFVQRGGMAGGRGVTRGAGGFRHMRGTPFRGRGARATGALRGSRGARGGRGGKLSGEALDKELDQYMMKSENYAVTKLNYELDSYMAEQSIQTPTPMET
ncbi:hypothetical protein DFJ77DRAFT_259555 [Powellomyces hirtus]|nr:hypothetical protein DFJ77DRAFT_259555 [Powellomyces hirtus]